MELSWVAMVNWTYSKTFPALEDLSAHRRVVLNLEGVDTIAHIALNGQIVGSTENMFRRLEKSEHEQIWFLKKYLGQSRKVSRKQNSHVVKKR